MLSDRMWCTLREGNTMQTCRKQFSKNNNRVLCKRICNCYRLETYSALPSGCSGAAASKVAVTAGCGVKIPAFSPVRKDENSSQNIQQSYCNFFFFKWGPILLFLFPILYHGCSVFCLRQNIFKCVIDNNV